MPAPGADDGRRAREAAELVALLGVVGWSQRTLADRLGIQERAVQRWVSGVNSVPVAVLPWLRGLAEGLREHPLPEGWEDGG